MGSELLIVGGLIVLLFGGSQLPKLARSLGSAKNEFEKAQTETASKGGSVPAPERPAPSAPSPDDPERR